MTHRAASLFTLAFVIALSSAAAQAQTARYYKWQGADRVVCAQTSPGKGWMRLKGSFIKSDCSI